MHRLLATHGYEEQVFPVPEGEARFGRRRLAACGAEAFFSAAARLPRLRAADAGDEAALLAAGQLEEMRATAAGYEATSVDAELPPPEMADRQLS